VPMASFAHLPPGAEGDPQAEADQRDACHSSTTMP
jgi:hypothetical protein